MKRVITILLVLLYSVSSIGATVTTHICAGKVKTCKCGKPSKKDICCSEKTVYLKSQDTHSFQTIAITPAKKINLSFGIEYVNFENETVYNFTNKSFISKRTLIDIGPPIYEFICVYLI